MNYYIGEIIAFAGPYAPAGFLPCDGRELSISNNQALYVLLGTTYGTTSSPAQTFRLPNMQGVVAVGVSATNTDYSLGKTGGQPSVQLSTATIPSHTHAVMASNGPATTGSPSNALLAVGSPTSVEIYTTDSTATKVAINNQAVTEAGNNQPHENRMPFVTISYLICTQGMFPNFQ